MRDVTGPLARRMLPSRERKRRRDRKDHPMRKSEIDHMLEVAVAKALGVKLPHLRTAARPVRRSTHAHRQIRHAA